MSNTISSFILDGISKPAPVFWSQRLNHFQNAYNTQLASRLYWSFFDHFPAKICRCFRVTVRRPRIQADSDKSSASNWRGVLVPPKAPFNKVPRVSN